MRAFLYNYASKNFILSFFVLFCLFLFVVFSLSPFSFVLPPVITPPHTYDDDWTFCACPALAHVGVFHFLLFVRLLFD